jgi:hypothetical protein
MKFDEVEHETLMKIQKEFGNFKFIETYTYESTPGLSITSTGKICIVKNYENRNSFSSKEGKEKLINSKIICNCGKTLKFDSKNVDAIIDHIISFHFVIHSSCEKESCKFCTYNEDSQCSIKNVQTNSNENCGLFYDVKNFPLFLTLRIRKFSPKLLNKLIEEGIKITCTRKNTETISIKYDILQAHELDSKIDKYEREEIFVCNTCKEKINLHWDDGYHGLSCNDAIKHVIEKHYPLKSYNTEELRCSSCKLLKCEICIVREKFKYDINKGCDLHQ